MTDNIIIMMCITDEAEILIKELQEHNSSDELVLTLSSAGVGCGAPVIKLEMRPPFEDDLIEKVDNFTIHIRPTIVKFLDDAEIMVEETFWGKRLKVKTVFGCR